MKGFIMFVILMLQIISGIMMVINYIREEIGWAAICLILENVFSILILVLCAI